MFIELGSFNFKLWYFLDINQIERRSKQLFERYPKRKLIPFAARTDCDDIACFEVGNPSGVNLIHDFAGEGYEQRDIYDNFWSWFEDAISEMIGFFNEEIDFEQKHEIT